jgi:Inosine-uridine preferring nucleoside hydrolase
MRKTGSRWPRRRWISERHRARADAAGLVQPVRRLTGLANSAQQERSTEFGAQDWLGDQPPVILDVDTGIDDALALIFAIRRPDLDVRAITCVAGNTSVDQVVENTCGILDLVAASDIPVPEGATRPLIEPPRDAS